MTGCKATKTNCPLNSFMIQKGTKFDCGYELIILIPSIKKYLYTYICDFLWKLYQTKWNILEFICNKFIPKLYKIKYAHF